MSILITGAAHRIGRAMAIRFHTAGHDVILHCNASRDAADALADEMNRSRPDSATVITLNLCQADLIDKFVSECLATTDKLTALINNASVFYPTPFGDVTTAQFDDLISVNLRAPYLLAQAFVDHLKGGSIVNIIDIYGEKPLKDFSAYSISKAGLAMMTKALAQELAPDIRVNGIAPGAILWPEGEAFSSEFNESVLANIPMGRIGDPTNIADTALFLVDQANYITGQIVSVDGGSSI